MDNRRREAPRADAPAPEEPAVDEAVFAIEQLPRGRGLKPIGVVVAAIAAFAIVGVVGGNRPVAQGARQPAPSSSAATASAQAADVATAWTWNAFKNGDDRLVPPAPPLLGLDATAADGLLFVHGDVYARGAMLVVVSVVDGTNHTLDVRAVNMPGGSTAFRTGPNDRFALAFQVGPAPAKQPAWVSAEAYDHDGVIIATARTQVAAPA